MGREAVLSYLSIRNLAIIDYLGIDYHAGFSALTGETGAGKSILIDALNLTLGRRSDLSLIRQGTEKCEVSAVFDIRQNPLAIQWLSQHELESSECIIRRQLYANGNTKAMINGQPIGQKSLSELGNFLVNIHSQHAHYALTQQNTQRQLLDSYGEHDRLLTQLDRHYRQYQQYQREYQQLMQTTSGEDKKVLLNFQLAELQAFNPLVNEYEELNQKHQYLASAEALKNDCHCALNTLSDMPGEAQANVQHLLDAALNTIRKYSDNHPTCQRATALLSDAEIYINEAVDELSHVLQAGEDAIEVEQQLGAIDRRLSKWHELARKYHVEPAQLYELSQRLQIELEQLQSISIQLEQLLEKRQHSVKEWQSIADQLSQSRHKKAHDLQHAITTYLHRLHMHTARFEIDITPSINHQDTHHTNPETAIKPTPYGQDNICFMFSANADMKTRELSKIASGGELSRVALAIAVANANNATIPTLVFDEVDVGIGGATTEIVGQLLRQLGQTQQVISITHQAQVAAKANTHLRIEKVSDNNQTSTTVSLLDRQQRISEIARMIGGVTITNATLQHAEEMLIQTSSSSAV